MAFTFQLEFILESWFHKFLTIIGGGASWLTVPLRSSEVRMN